MTDENQQSPRADSPRYYPHLLFWTWVGVFGALTVLPFLWIVPDGPTEKKGFSGLSAVRTEQKSLVWFGLVWQSLFLNSWLNILYSRTLQQLPAALLNLGMCATTPIGLLADGLGLQADVGAGPPGWGQVLYSS